MTNLKNIPLTNPPQVILTRIPLLADMACILLGFLKHVTLGMLLGGEVYQTPMFQECMDADYCAYVTRQGFAAD